MSFIEELKRRNVIRVAIAYGAIAWLLLQVADVVLPTFGSPEWVMQAFTFLLILGLPVALVLAWAFELTPEGVKREEDVDRSASISGLTGRKLDFVIIAVLVLAVSVLVLDRYTGPSESGSPQPVNKSIAVLPFVNMSDDANNEYFSDGISEEILNALAKVGDLKVAGRTSSFAFKNRNEDLRTIGEALAVSHILEGSVRKSGIQVRVTAQLVKADDGYQLWSQTYDRELTDIFAIQDEIAAEILIQLKAQLLDEERQVLASQRTDPEVYELYLLAKQRLYGRTLQSIESAVDILDQAIAIDPDYAPAYAQRGIATMLLSDNSYGNIPQAEAFLQGRRDVEAALEISPQLAEAWAGLGLYHVNQPMQHEEAIEALVKALSINPNLIDASNWLQMALNASGDSRAALQLLERMTQRDPLYLPAFGNAVTVFNDFGEEEKAQALIDQFRIFDPNNPHLLHVDAEHHFYYGRAAEGLRLAERAYQLSPADVDSQLAVSDGLFQTLQIRRLAEEGFGVHKVVALDLLGRRDEAFELAFELSGDGYLASLFWLFNRTDRSQELINYLEERWFSPDIMPADYPYSHDGYTVIAEVALAYSRIGNTKHFEDALSLLENAISHLSDQGIDNCRFMYRNAEYLALAGKYDEAITQLEHAIKRGMLMCAPIAAYSPIFEPLHNDPRFAALKTVLVENINVEREILGLEAIDPTDQIWHQPATTLN